MIAKKGDRKKLASQELFILKKASETYEEQL